MKKNLFTIAAGLLIGFTANAQEGGPKLIEESGWAVVDSTTNHKALSGFTKENGIDNKDKAFVQEGKSSSGSNYTVTYSGDVMKIDFEQTAATNYISCNLQFIEWTGEEDPSSKFNKFYKYNTGTSAVGDNPDTEEDESKPAVITPQTNENAQVAYGHTIDMSNSENAVIAFEYKSATAVTGFRIDLKDILGRTSNSSDFPSNIKFDLPVANDFTWMILSFAGDALADQSITPENGIVYDQYTGDWWGAPVVHNDVCKPLQMNAIAGINITFEDGEGGTVGTKHTVEIKNLVIGAEDPADADVWGIVTSTGFKTVNGTELEVVGGVVYSAGQIVVTSITGQVVAIANGEFDTKSLKAGVYLIKAAEGTAKIVK